MWGYHTYALSAVSCESSFTATSKSTIGVGTLSIFVAVINTAGAFIDIWNHKETYSSDLNVSGVEKGTKPWKTHFAVASIPSKIKEIKRIRTKRET